MEGRMKRMLITGGLGFLGSYAIEKYKLEYDVTVLDNLSSNTLNMTDTLLSGINFINSTVLNYTWDIHRKFDVILHLASPVGPVGILKHSGHIAGLIIDDIYHMIRGALLNDATLVYVSTSEVYGYRSRMESLKEDDSKLLIGAYKVRNEYAIAKLLGEIILCNMSKTTPLKYQIIRPFNISGARQLKTGGFVIPTFVQQALKNEPITVFGDGSQIRSFTHAKDIIEGIDCILKHSNESDIWNIGTPNNALSVKELAERIKRKTNSSSNLVFVDPKTIHGPLYDEAWDKIPNSDKIISKLQWQSTQNIDDILSDVIQYYRNRL